MKLINIKTGVAMFEGEWVVMCKVTDVEGNVLLDQLARADDGLPMTEEQAEAKAHELTGVLMAHYGQGAN